MVSVKQSEYQKAKKDLEIYQQEWAKYAPLGDDTLLIRLGKQALQEKIEEAEKFIARYEKEQRYMETIARLDDLFVDKNDVHYGELEALFGFSFNEVYDAEQFLRNQKDVIPNSFDMIAFLLADRLFHGELMKIVHRGKVPPPNIFLE